MERNISTDKGDLDKEKLSNHLTLKCYDFIPAVIDKLGGITGIREIYLNL